LNILFITNELRKRCNDPRLAQRGWGGHRAKLVGRRLDQLKAAPTLADFMPTPGRPHALHGDREGEFTVDLDGPYRLVFEPADKPLPVSPTTNELIYEQVTSVCIRGVEDTHE
jgi:proteic killer suppression protein